MPGSIANAEPSEVMPHTLSRAFGHEREYPILANEYRNGESQRSLEIPLVTATSRKRWRLTKRLTAMQIQALREFYLARSGGYEPFLWYDPWETVPQFTHDETGISPHGRYTVRFEGPFEQSIFIGGRSEITIQLVEIA